MIHIDYQDKRPIWLQIVNGFEDLILTGVLQEGDRIPSVRSLAMELSINPNTIQKAYAQLERKGYIASKKGVGNYVRKRHELLDDKKEDMITELTVWMQRTAEFSFDAEEMFAEAKSRMQKKGKL